MKLAEELRKLSDETISKKVELEEKIIEEVTSYFKNIFQSKEFYDELKEVCSEPRPLLEKEYITYAEVSSRPYSLHTYFTIFHFEYDCEKTLTEDLRKYILNSIRDIFIKQLLDFGFTASSEAKTLYKYEIEIFW